MALKVPSFGPAQSFGSIVGEPKDLLWPVVAYRITLPKRVRNKDDDGENLNAFEKVVLGIIDAGDGYEYSEEELSAETCLPSAFLRGVISRLYDRGFIDEHNLIIAQKKSSWKDELSKDNVRYVAAIVYRELVTGKLLPVLQITGDHPQKWLSQNQLESLEKKAYFIPRLCDDRRFGTPSPQDVINVRERMVRHNAFKGKGVPPPPNQILVQKQYDVYFLHCRIAVQKADSDFRITDPFGDGFSNDLEKAFSFLLGNNETVANWWNGNLLKFKSVDDGALASGSTVRFCCDQKSKSQYPDLIDQLNPGSYPYRSMEKLHAAIEWALFYHCYSIDSQRLKRAEILLREVVPAEEQEEFLASAAMQLGCSEVPAGCFIPVAPGRVEDFRNGKTEFSTVIALAVLASDVGDTENRFLQLIRESPDVLARFVRIKDFRKAQHHGAASYGRGNEKLEDDEFVCHVVRTLLPGLRFDSDMNVERAQTMAFDQKVEARLGVCSTLGYGMFNRLPDEIKECLFAAEQAFLFRENSDVLPMLNNLYPALQNLLTVRIANSTVVNRIWRGMNYMSEADKAAKRAGFDSLPDTLSRVKRNLIDGAVGFGRSKPSLGACVIALLLKESSEVLSRVAQDCPGFLRYIGYVASKCEHGNKSVIESEDEIKEFRKATYSTIKTLMEV